MQITELEITGSWHARFPAWNDSRGSFREWFKHQEIFEATGLNFSVAQANISESKRGVVRGIHYSLAASGQAKLITCISGEIRDVIVDIRPTSNTFGKHTVVELEGGSGDAVLIGPGLGHAFSALAEKSTVAYLLNSPFAPSMEYEINPLDPELGIEWGFPGAQLLLSEKDLAAPNLAERMNQRLLPE
jgi:dTDP-4-dehydrorhamnose 3,5-epimerase